MVGHKEGCRWCLTLSDGGCYGSKEVVTARWEGVGVGNSDLSAGGVRRLDDGMEHVCELDGRRAPRRWARRRLPSQRRRYNRRMKLKGGGESESRSRWTRTAV
ncbi:hypothetical protein HPP92_015907 [Vanilla planifolia]|uniref:Uncharacterized protein n=1 Tax=Vanilla planifolia TaxID=51239 RepID=A0A835QI64_VANPL|nr:hypothetical protein HPP92_016498 [Vanilla planifolia]KAG0471361.1 hypothetical protein HPP92_015907 [Vanilla planifolia]